MEHKREREFGIRNTWIHTHPTAERGAYLVLPFNFSAVDPGHDKIEASFLNHIKGRGHSARRYWECNCLNLDVQDEKDNDGRRSLSWINILVILSSLLSWFEIS